MTTFASVILEVDADVANRVKSKRFDGDDDDDSVPVPRVASLATSLKSATHSTDPTLRDSSSRGIATSTQHRKVIAGSAVSKVEAETRSLRRFFVLLHSRTELALAADTGQSVRSHLIFSTRQTMHAVE